MKAYSTVITFFLLLFYVGSAEALQCKFFLSPAISKDFQPKKPIRFMSLNTLNLYLHQGKYAWTENGFEKLNQDHLPRQKPERHTQGIADAIIETQPDFIMLQEVEGKESLDRFNRRYLGNAYKVYMPPTNDTRGIGTAFLVRYGTGIKVKRESSAELSWTNKNGQLEKIFSRNFPLFKIFLEDHDVPRLIVAGVHYKSKRDRADDPRSFYKRQKEAETSVQILESAQDRYPNVPQIVMGDFNSTRDKKELDSFRRLGMIDLNDRPELFNDEGDLGLATFSFFRKGQGEPILESLDGAFLSRSLESSLLSSTVYRYKHPETGKVIPLPRTIDERNQLPSDHYPILFDLDPEVLYSEYNAED